MKNKNYFKELGLEVLLQLILFIMISYIIHTSPTDILIIVLIVMYRIVTKFLTEPEKW